jgi:hypothetical protein
MSAYKLIECNLVVKEFLLTALEDLGFKPVVKDSDIKLTGWQGDERPEAASIIVPKEQLNATFTGASNDLGFSWDNKSKSYIMKVSDYDASLEIDKRVMQAYAKAGIEKALAINKFKNTRSTQLKQKTRVNVSIVTSKII